MKWFTLLNSSPASTNNKKKDNCPIANPFLHRQLVAIDYSSC